MVVLLLCVNIQQPQQFEKILVHITGCPVCKGLSASLQRCDVTPGENETNLPSDDRYPRVASGATLCFVLRDATHEAV